MDFERIHELGAERHREAWLIANRAATTNLWDSGLDISNPDVKRAVSLIVLRVLDAIRARSPVPAPEPVQHEFSCPGGELDEVWIENAFVHIERMDDTAFWIGIEGKGKPMLHLNTGVHRGQWYFNIEVDSLEKPEFLSVQRPRKGTHAPRGKRREPVGEKLIEALEALLLMTERPLKNELENCPNGSCANCIKIDEVLSNVGAALKLAEERK